MRVYNGFDLYDYGYKLIVIETRLTNDLPETVLGGLYHTLKAPSHYGACSTLKVHSQPLSTKWSHMASSLNTDFKYFEAALNVLPLSDINL